MSIKIINVTKTYNKQVALDKINFTVGKGEIFGFIGPNGAGKTTLMKIIMGIIPPDEGEVFVNEKNILLDSIKVRKEIGYLPENNPLYLDMYIKELLYISGQYYGLKKRELKKRINEIIELVGLGSELRKKIGALSKGYKQRVGLAVALLHNPSVLIMDEPTSGLDPNQVIEIRNLIKELGKEKTVLLSTHIMQEVEAICNRIIIINKGKIVADSKNDDLRKFAESFNKQVIIVEFKNSVTKKELEKIKGITQVKEISKTKFIIEANCQDDIRYILYNYSVTSNNPILTMQKKDKGLEEIFHELTKG
ncbi:MAG: ATP-binding cassette domain-containing protein [Bacteroidales bacterium]|nr:ATP-binding cassette domain-containing protein [Bacteroidales bacterium]